MLIEKQRQDGRLTLDAESIEGLMARSEAPVSGAPLHCPAVGTIVFVIVSPKEPKEPREPRRR
ncbi:MULTISPECIES: hypothetical protein [unclassified Streptomyces]|uniref:hypothetical protein n=1 Tax=unclassified Streptomyces TaxID=2593676 RepID=UPI00336ACDDC